MRYVFKRCVAIGLHVCYDYGIMNNNMLTLCMRYMGRVVHMHSHAPSHPLKCILNFTIAYICSS